MAEGRARRGGWTYVILAALALGVFLVVNHVSASSEAPPAAATASSTLAPGIDRPPLAIATRPLVSTRLTPGTVPGPAPHCGRGGCCPTRVRTFGTRADITRVIAAFQHRGFRYAAPPLVAPVSGDPRTSGTYLRWLGELPGDARSWRLVNVATGALDGHPNWQTVFQVSQARCEIP